MAGSMRASRSARRLICFVVVCLTVGAALSPAFASDKAAKVVTADATVVSIALHSADSCADYGLFRWQAVKGVDSYTLKFNDAAFGGALQTKVVAKPFTEDQKEAPGSPLNAPAGTHQAGWTGIFGSPPCGEPVDYSGRLTNARVQYVREGSWIDGTIKAPKCASSGCPSVSGIKVTAKGKTVKSAVTNAIGKYSIKVQKGEYKIVPSKGQLEFDPEERTERVGDNDSVQANFSIHYFAPDPLAVAVVQKVVGRDGRLPNAEFLRDGKWRPLREDAELRVRDKIRTDAFTTVRFEFAIGGSMGVNRRSEVTITSEGNAATPKPTPSVKLTKGQMWAKCQKLKEPLEIETGGGGVMGIRG